MLTRTRTIVASAAVAIALGSGGTAASAAIATTWTVTPGGTVTVVLPSGGAVKILNAATGGTVVTCSAVTGSGALKSGRGLPGRGIGTVTAFSLSNCSPSVSFSSSGFPWSLNALSYTATTGVTAGRMTGIHITYTGHISPTQTCSGVVDGTSDTANNGTIPFRYKNATHTLRFIKGGNLHVYDNTCPNVTNGEKLAFTASYKVSPRQTITSP